MNIYLYWPVYKILEREVLQLAESIHFDDDQLGVYSVRIAELLIRCSMEIESLIKDLYRNNNSGQEPKSPGAALLSLDKVWGLKHKVVIISSPSIYFDKKENRLFAPFGYEREDENDYYRAYNAVKHDRVKNLRMATVHILLRALAALYLLNIYYKDEVIRGQNSITKDVYTILGPVLGSAIHSTLGLGSALFSVLAGSYTIRLPVIEDVGVKPTEALACTYLYKCADSLLKSLHQPAIEAQKKAYEILREELSKNPKVNLTNADNLLGMAEKIGGIDLVRRIWRLIHDIWNELTKSQKIGVLNKGQPICIHSDSLHKDNP